MMSYSLNIYFVLLLSYFTSLRNLLEENEYLTSLILNFKIIGEVAWRLIEQFNNNLLIVFTFKLISHPILLL